MSVVSLAPFLDGEFLALRLLIVGVYNQYLTLTIVNNRMLSINNYD